MGRQMDYEEREAREADFLLRMERMERFCPVKEVWDAEVPGGDSTGDPDGDSPRQTDVLG